MRMQSGLAPAAGDELPYRSVSSLAVLSLVLGLLSVTALTSPGAWLVPLPAALCAVWALHRIRQRPDELLGRKAALAGLALALSFGCWAPARYFTDRWLINRQASRRRLLSKYSSLMLGQPTRSPLILF